MKWSVLLSTNMISGPVGMANVYHENRNSENTELNLNSDERPVKRMKRDQNGILSCDQCEYTTKNINHLNL